jgi:hypothetical protein
MNMTEQTLSDRLAQLPKRYLIPADELDFTHMVIGVPPAAIIVDIPNLNSERTHAALLKGCETLGYQVKLSPRQRGKRFAVTHEKTSFLGKSKGEACASAYLMLSKAHHWANENANEKAVDTGSTPA